MREIASLYGGLDLGEAPRLTAKGELWFSDAFGGGIYRRSSIGAVQKYHSDLMMVAGLALNDSGEVIVASLEGLLALTPGSGKTRNLGLMLDGKKLADVNDIEADRHGNIYGGVIDRVGMANGLPIREWAVGKLFRVDTDGGCTLVGELRNPNGMAFSLDDRILYVVESGHGVWAYDVGQDGSLRNKALFALIDGSGDSGDGCDGLTVDAEGNVLVCCVATSEIRTFGADGTLKARLKLPVRPTSLEFGGDDLMDLYVSTGELQDKGRGEILLFRTDIPGRKSHDAKLKIDRFIG